MFITKRTLRQGMTIFPSALISFSFGCVFGWIGPALEHFKSGEASFVASKEELSWIASAYFITEVGFAAANGLCTKKVGRKPMILFSAFLQALGWIVKVLANTPEMFILGRVIHGAAAGTFDVIWCMYLGEVTSPTERGVYGSLFISLFLGGVLAIYFLSLWVPFICLAAIPCTISAIAFLLSFFAKETPFYLVKKGNPEKAKVNLAWLRGKDDLTRVEDEFNEIKRYVEEDAARNYGLMHVLRNLSKYKVSIVGLLIFTFAQPSGYMIILTFQTMLLDLYDDSKSGSDLTLIYGLLQFIFINLAPLVLETIGRKKPMIFGFSVLTLVHVGLAYLFYVGEHDRDSIPHLPYYIFGLFTVYGCIFALTILPTVYVLKSELFPHEIKSLANCSATVTNALVNFVVVKLFSWIWSTFGLHANFILYAIICFVSILYVQLLIPETRGKTLVQIQEKIDMKYRKKCAAVSES